jgi:hypothetical protein
MKKRIAFSLQKMTQPATMVTLGRAVKRNLILLGSLSSVLMLKS